MTFSIEIVDSQKDIDEIYRLIENTPKELSIEELASVDESNIKAVLLEHMSESDNRLFKVVTHGKIVGVLGLGVAQYWWSSDNFLTNTITYVHPEHRTFALFNRFLNLMEDTATLLKLKLVVDFFGQDAKRKGQVVERRGGYRKIGISYLRDE